jgi:sulfur carrier protein ThiS
VSCVDCGTRTLPQNARKDRPWTTAAALRIGDRANVGALCFECGNKRRALLGFPLEQCGGESVTDQRPFPAPVGPIKTARKTVRINKQSYSWDISSLESLIVKWNDYVCYDEYKGRGIDFKKWVVRVNDRQIPSNEFSQHPVADGDVIAIMPGCLLHPF